MPLKAYKSDYFKCSKCGLRFYSSKTLSIHFRSHNPEDPFQHHSVSPKDDKNSFPCMDCDRVFTSNNSLCLHRRIHEREAELLANPDADGGMVKCNLCDKVAINKYSLQQHIRWKHEGKNPRNSEAINAAR